MEPLRQRIVTQLSPSADCYLIDSMPLEACKLSRAKRSRICQESPQTTPDYGYCAAHNSHYFGDKIHAVSSPQGVLKTFDISKASCHDIHYLHDVQAQLSNCILVGDKGYLSQQWQQGLFASSATQLETPKRQNQQASVPFSPVLRKARKRIETLFSQLCDQFMIRRNCAKSFQGFATRILSKVTALTMIQWFNHRCGNNINNLKIVVA